MEEFTGEVEALEARRKAALDTLRTATDPAEIERLKRELAEIEVVFNALGEEDA